MFNKHIGITTSSFGEYSKKPLEDLKKAGYQLHVNGHGRKLDSDELIALLAGCAGVIAGTETYNKKVLSSLPELKIISRVGTGLDSIDLEECKSRQITVCSTPDGPVQAVGELVIGLMLSLLRHIPQQDLLIRRGKWAKLMGRSMADKSVGIIGLGKIGCKVAELALGLGAGKIFYFDGPINNTRFIKCQSKEELLAACDIISIHVPLMEETKSLIGEREFSLMKPEAVLINCARGGVVNEDALYKALHGQQIKGAALDVFEKEPYVGPLTQLDNIILTPHIGSYTQEARGLMESEAVLNLLKHL